MVGLTPPYCTLSGSLLQTHSSLVLWTGHTLSSEWNTGCALKTIGGQSEVRQEGMFEQFASEVRCKSKLEL